MKRLWFALGFLGWTTVTMGLAAPGCSNRLGPVSATESAGSVGNANLPTIVLERSKECMELDGRQVGPGRVVLESTVTLNEDGDIVSVNIGGLPETARDFSACIRNVLERVYQKIEADLSV
jgi:hypothetical protein